MITVEMMRGRRIRIEIGGKGFGIEICSRWLSRVRMLTGNVVNAFIGRFSIRWKIFWCTILLSQRIVIVRWRFPCVSCRRWLSMILCCRIFCFEIVKMIVVVRWCCRRIRCRRNPRSSNVRFDGLLAAQAARGLLTSALLFRFVAWSGLFRWRRPGNRFLFLGFFLVLRRKSKSVLN